MRKMTLEEIQQTEFQMLIEFDKFCALHNLKYYLGGGTMLGAVRHKGFIPWDDDIDVNMPRPDYMNFLELNKDGKLNDDLRLSDLSLDKENTFSPTLKIYNRHTFVKLNGFRIENNTGLWIDIFPIDGLSESRFLRLLQFYLVRILSIWISLCVKKIGSRRNSRFYSLAQYAFIFVVPIIRMLGYKKLVGYIDKLSKIYPYEDAEYVGVLTGRAVEKEAMLKSHMEPTIKVEFCGKEFYAPANYDEYLTNLYGDYMKLPPEEDRVPKHETEAYWRDEE